MTALDAPVGIPLWALLVVAAGILIALVARYFVAQTKNRVWYALGAGFGAAFGSILTEPVHPQSLMGRLIGPPVEALHESAKEAEKEARTLKEALVTTAPKEKEPNGRTKT